MRSEGLIGDGPIMGQEVGGVVLQSRRVRRDIEDRAPSIEEGPVKNLSQEDS